MTTATTTSSPSSAARRSKLPPGPKGAPGFGLIFEAWKDPLTVVSDAVRGYGDTVSLRFGPKLYVLVSRPDDIRHVLLGNAQNYPKSRNYDGLRLVLGNGLVTSEGEFWKRQRKLATPAFHRERLVGFADTMARATGDMLERWDREGDGEIDVHEEMMALTLRIVGLTLFSIDLEQHAKALAPAITTCLEKANSVAEDLFVFPTWVPTPGNRRFRKAMAELDAVVAEIVETRTKSGQVGDDLLGMLMAATDDTGAKMSPKQLRDEVMTLMLAGHETTAVSLSWTFYLLGKHPEYVRQIRAEARSILGERPRLAFADIPRLTTTSAVVDESMRLYPPVWMFERQAVAEDTIGEYRVPAGAHVGICPWTIHRRAENFVDPLRFDPSRFAQGKDASAQKYTYLPFGGGPRTCIGNSFALMEAKLLLAMIVARYDLSLVTDEHPTMDPGITLRPANGLRVRRARA